MATGSLNESRENDSRSRRMSIVEDDLEQFIVPPPPPAANVVEADGSRLIIEKIVNENFKSYAGKRELGPFHKYFSAIVGPNGSGKSNVIDSMLFVFGYRANRLRTKKVSALLHDSHEYGKASSCTVTVHFARMIDVPDSEDFQIVPDSKFAISRTANADNSSYYTINGKRAQQREVCDRLRLHGIDLDHNRFLILQGEVEQISLMKPKAEKDSETGMLEYLEDIIGSSRLKEHIEKLNELVKQQSEVRDDKWNRCKLAGDALEQLEAPKDAALRYVEMENKVTISTHKLLQKKISMANASIAKFTETVSKLESEMTELKESLSEKRKQMKGIEKNNADKVAELERLQAAKEKGKAEFDAKKQRDVQLQQEVERSNKRRKELAEQLKKEEEKKVALQNLPAKNQETITALEKMEVTLEAEVQEVEQKHAKVLASLQTDTLSLQEEKESLQKELTQLLSAVNEAKAKYEVGNTELTLYTSRQTSEVKKLEDLKSKLEEIVSGLDKSDEEKNGLVDNLTRREKEQSEQTKELSRYKREEATLDEDRRKLQITVEESRSSMQQNKSRGRVLDALMQAKQSGELPGVYGRMGDLGGIDAKYDVAISTAAGALDHIVVDNVDTAEACIMFLKKHDIGRASFVALDKQEHFKKNYQRPFKSPENVPRLFDLIQVADERMRPAFYYALHDTLVASSLDQASRIAYGATRYRVVTEAGELIEIAGTMSGGGRQVLRGRMGRKAEKTADAIAPKDFEQLERTLSEKTGKLTEVRRKIAQLEDRISANNIEIGNAKKRLEKIDTEVKQWRSQEPVLKKQISTQEKKVQETTPEPTYLAKLQKDLEKAQKHLDEASSNARIVEQQVEKINAEIMAKTKGRLQKVQKELDDVAAKLEKVRQEKTKLRVAVTTAGRNLSKCETRITNMKSEIETCVEKIKRSAADIQSNEVDAKATLKHFEELDKELSELQSTNKDYLTELNACRKAEAELKSKEIDLKEDLSRAKAELEAKSHKITGDRKKMKSLKLTAIPLPATQPAFVEYTDEEIAAISADDLLNEVKHAEETLPKPRPNLGAIQDYMKQQDVYKEREEDLERATQKRNKSRAFLDKLKETRQSEFNRGFQVISHKVKECYQMLAEGGDAELELINTMDPFIDGVKFTVRPPRKSWKEIQFLSGGEKTLSSLALIFALHYFKPTPLYFMDEIDSALDWKNTTIVANYLKERTKNAQFIVVSLRENMYELADILVGIYKTKNCTRTISTHPQKFGKEIEVEN